MKGIYQGFIGADFGMDQETLSFMIDSTSSVRLELALEQSLPPKFKTELTQEGNENFAFQAEPLFLISL